MVAAAAAAEAVEGVERIERDECGRYVPYDIINATTPRISAQHTSCAFVFLTTCSVLQAHSGHHRSYTACCRKMDVTTLGSSLLITYRILAGV